MDRIKKLTEELSDLCLEIRIRAAKQLGELGTQHKEAEYALLHRFRIAEDRVEVKALLAALVEIGPDALKHASDLRRRTKEREADAVYAKSMTVAQAKEAVKSLLWLYGDESPPESQWGALEWTLIAIGQEVPEVIPDLLSVYEGNEALRVVISCVLENVGYKRPEVGDGLVPLLRHKDPVIVDAAADVLGRGVKVGEKVNEAVNILLDLSLQRDGGWELGEQALIAMGSGENHPDVVSAFLEILRRQPDSSDSGPIFHLLGRMVQRNREKGVSTLLDLLHHPMPVVRMTAVDACGWCLSNNHVIDGVCQATKDKDSRVRLAALMALSSCPLPFAGQAIGCLIASLKDQESCVRNQAKESLTFLAEGIVSRI